MASFPNLSSGFPTIYPLTRSVEHKTRVLKFGDDSEQRWAIAKPLARFVLEYRDLRSADVDLIRDFFTTTKGAFDKTWEITIDGTTYQNLCFDTDELRIEETEKGRYSLRLPVRQVK